MDSYGRIHTNLTNLSRDLRQFLYLKKDDDYLSQTDIRNSQAFIYSLLLRKLERISKGDPHKEKQELLSKIIKYTEEGIEEDKIEKEKEKRRRDKETKVLTREKGKKDGRGDGRGEGKGMAGMEEPSCVSSCEPKQHLSPFVPSTCGLVREFSGVASGCCETTYDDAKTQKQTQMAIFGFEQAVAVASGPGKFERYVDDCCQGLLYEELSDSLPDDHEYRKLDRKKFKKAFFREAIFCRSRHAKDRPLKEAFAKLHPGVWEVTCLLKFGHHAVLPKLLQNIESEYVVAGAAKAFMKMHPKAFVATIHDSLMVPSRYREDASKLLREVFMEAGLVPSVSVETVTWY